MAIFINIFILCIILITSNTQEAKQKDFLRDTNKITSVAQKRDINELEELSTELERVWYKKNTEKYVSMMLEICRAFSLHDFHNAQQFVKAREFAILALEKSSELPEKSKIPIEIELQLFTNYILNNYEYNKESQKKDWLSQRSLISKQYFYAWKRLENAIDNNFDPNEILPSWPQPSKYDGIWLAGMSPESIKDPVVRAEYQKALDKFNETMRQYNNQIQLRKLKNEYLPKIQKKILQLYSGPVFDSKSLEVEALEKDIARYIIDEKNRKNMLEEIKKEME